MVAPTFKHNATCPWGPQITAQQPLHLHPAATTTPEDAVSNRPSTSPGSRIRCWWRPRRGHHPLARVPRVGYSLRASPAGGGSGSHRNLLTYLTVHALCSFPISLLVSILGLRTPSGPWSSSTHLHLPFCTCSHVLSSSPLPNEVEESAMVDGCQPARAIWRVVPSPCGPCILTVVIFDASRLCA